MAQQRQPLPNHSPFIDPSEDDDDPGAALERTKLAVSLTPEPTQEDIPLALLHTTCANPSRWQAHLIDPRRRSWLHTSSALSNIYLTDLSNLQEHLQWTELLTSNRKRILRRTAWLVDRGCNCDYTYGPHRVHPQPMPQWFRDMAHRWLQTFHFTEGMFPNSVNLNLYENDAQGVEWHADDEPLFQALNRDAAIISVSLGTTREFSFGLRPPGNLRASYPIKGTVSSILLHHGDLCLMEGKFQKYYLHRVPTLRLPLGDDYYITEGPRINATFRWIVQHIRPCQLS